MEVRRLDAALVWARSLPRGEAKQPKRCQAAAPKKGLPIAPMLYRGVSFLPGNTPAWREPTMGIEPITCALRGRRSASLSYIGTVSPPGIGPGLRSSENRVRPPHPEDVSFSIPAGTRTRIRTFARSDACPFAPPGWQQER